MTASVLEAPNAPEESKAPKSATVVEYTTLGDVPAGRPQMKLADRCDACGPASQAFNIAISSTTGNELYLCNHHARTREAGLLKQGFTIEKHAYSNTEGIKAVPPAEKR